MRTSYLTEMTGVGQLVIYNVINLPVRVSTCSSVSYTHLDVYKRQEYYNGPQDIPPEHRIFAYPEKAEPVHSVLAALKRFQEAPPAPKKDKAGPSHEER